MSKSQEVELGIIGTEKTSTQTHAIKVAIREWMGDLGVDLRRWYKKGNEWCPTAKGIRLRADEISPAITFLERAEQELKKNGTLK